MVDYRLLGPLEVVDGDGRRVDIGGRQPRILLAVLLVAGGRRVTVDALADAIWSGEPPASATGTVQSYVSRLRRRLGPRHLTWDEAGYQLQVAAGQVDARRFEALAEEGRALLAAGRAEEARAVLADAEALWRGPALADFAHLEFAMGPAARLEQRRLAAIEDRLGADLALGRHAAAIGELAELVGANPLREGLQVQLALALYRSGRQAEALRALAGAGRTLREELGIEPSRQLQDLEAAILAHDPSLDAPVAVGQRAAPPPPVAPERRPGPALIGRDHELAALVAALDESADDARFVVIEGEPGIGKTRLADELRAVADSRGAMAVWGRSDEGGAAPALWPWLPPLRTIAAAAAVAPAVTQLLSGDAPVQAAQERSAQFERFEAVAALLDDVAATRPVAILLDDLQWADPTSLELVSFLAGRLRRGVLIAGTMRQLEVGRNDAVTDALAAIARRPGSRRLQLRGLTPTATAEVLESATGNVAASVAATIHQRAEGNPFYAIELSRLVDEEGGIAGEVPATVGDVVRRRLARLPQATVDLLGVAAVVGRDVEMGLLARAADRTFDAVIDGLEPAVVHRLLVEVPELPAVLRFSHALVREVVLDDMTSLRRARLHLKVADAIESGGAGVDDTEILAEHLWRAAPVGVGHRAAEALERAAEVALRRVSYAAAEDSLRKAVQLRRATSASLEHREAELRAICRLLEVAKARRYFQGATDLDVLGRAKELAERCRQRDVLVDLVWFEWSALATSCRREEAAPLAVEIRRLTSEDPRPGVRATGHQVYAVLSWGAGRISEAVEHLDIAVDLLDQAGPPADSFAMERALVSNTFWIWHHVVVGDLTPEEGFARFDDLIAAMPDRFAVASICGFAATMAVTVGRWDETDHYATIGIEAGAGGQFAFWDGQFLMQRGIVLAGRGQVDEGVASFAEGEARYTSIGGRSALSTFRASLALQLVEQGRTEEAGRWAQAARDELDTYDERWNEPIVLMAEAAVAGAGGDAGEAAELYGCAADAATLQGSHALARRALELVAVTHRIRG
ncbi:MAG TPA: BTAD domain-containing putative transcriptional regulator [Acidimicrobiales bacterium]|nr:BTAD domain-containing putative transcriptional regulator [Acidimicrobiales bacterium]